MPRGDLSKTGQANVARTARAWGRLKDRSYKDLEELKDGDEAWRAVSVRTHVALALVQADRKEAAAKEAAQAGRGGGTLNLVMVVPRMRDHSKWEELAAAVDRGDAIDVEAVETTPEPDDDGEAA